MASSHFSTALLLATCSAFVLTGCGGGGGGSTTTSSSTTTTTASSITSANAKDVSAQAYAASDALNSQINGSSGLVTAVSVNAASGTGLLGAALQQAYFALGSSSANLVVGVATTETRNCTQGGTISVSTNGDTTSILASNCRLDGLKLNGATSIKSSGFTGTPSANGAWSGTLAMTFSNFAIDNGVTSDTANGDLSLTYNQTNTGTASFSARANTLQLRTIKGNTTTDLTISALDYSGSVDSANLYTYRANYTLSGNFTKLGNATYVIKTMTDFKQKATSYPSQGVMTITAGDKSSLTLTTVNSTTVKLDLDKNGDSVSDETITSSWTDLASLI